MIKPDKSEKPTARHERGLEAIAGLQTATNRLPHISKKKILTLTMQTSQVCTGQIKTKKPVLNKHDRLLYFESKLLMRLIF